MKILVFSDSHGAVRPMESAILREKPDQVLHLGDCIPDARALTHLGVPVLSVLGNCDWGETGPTTLTPTFGGKKIFMTHGHMYSVKIQYQKLLYSALEQEADVVLFGHTHVPECFFQRGMWVMNPGPSVFGGVYGRIDIENGDITCSLQPMEKS